MISHIDYIRILEKWLPFARKYIYRIPERPDLECFGTGYNNWGVQTNQKAFAAFAVCAGSPEFDEKNSGISRNEILEHSLKILRFSLESHIEGNYHCLDGTKWGHTWISVLGMERMMHGIEAIKKYLTQHDWELLKTVMVSEADWLLEGYFRDDPKQKGRILAGLTQHNHPESNIWNGAHLMRTVMLFPDVKKKKKYIEKATAFIINGISVASDAKCKQLVNGKPVSQWYAGSNFFPSFALNHHGYLNVGYMVICLSNLAMLHFAYRSMGMKAPDFIYRHIDKLWQLVKLCTFPDGRICRIGGDTRVRYCYCQDYAIPVWLMIKDLFGDRDCDNFEEQWLEIIKKEMDTNADGSFLSRRCRDFISVAPIYYTRLETDRAASISMAAHWKRILNIEEKILTDKPLKQAWHDRYHGACIVRGKNSIRSWCWIAAQPPQGLCIPLKESDIAEWRYNCAGYVSGLGKINYQQPVYHKEFLFVDGLLLLQARNRYQK